MKLMDAPHARNGLAMMIGESFWGFQAFMLAPATFFAVLLQEYGAGKLMVGSISALELGGVTLFHRSGCGHCPVCGVGPGRLDRADFAVQIAGCGLSPVLDLDARLGA